MCKPALMFKKRTQKHKCDNILSPTLHIRISLNFNMHNKYICTIYNNHSKIILFFLNINLIIYYINTVNLLKICVTDFREIKKQTTLTGFEHNHLNFHQSKIKMKENVTKDLSEKNFSILAISIN